MRQVWKHNNVRTKPLAGEAAGRFGTMVVKTIHLAIAFFADVVRYIGYQFSRPLSLYDGKANQISNAMPTTYSWNRLPPPPIEAAPPTDITPLPIEEPAQIESRLPIEEPAQIESRLPSDKSSVEKSAPEKPWPPDWPPEKPWPDDVDISVIRGISGICLFYIALYVLRTWSQSPPVSQPLPVDIYQPLPVDIFSVAGGTKEAIIKRIANADPVKILESGTLFVSESTGHILGLSTQLIQVAKQIRSLFGSCSYPQFYSSIIGGGAFTHPEFCAKLLSTINRAYKAAILLVHPDNGGTHELALKVNGARAGLLECMGLR